MKALRRVISVICLLLASPGAVGAMPIDLSVERLFDLCASASVAAAAKTGDQLGWERLAEAEIEDWRAGFVAHNGGSVELVGWKRVRDGKAETTSFWIATGPNAHKGCTYGTEDAASFLDALTEWLGEPDSLEEYDDVEAVTAWWERDDGEYSFSQVGASASVLIKPNWP
ncbi:hypothetical protein SAMN06295905_3382 [Devosia lucknowensis]|uniref:Uncharacterized protein n=1 Tax=Devosia lucknowensis TaxID=1096929 RepID=A0A1Y6G8K7_9HYPH|nr:hypothetical protein [Devosia lucknowensis]SMQ86084.1 hypothetical protein SAMN06295905_3382 [Devosia lucknowensis]